MKKVIIAVLLLVAVAGHPAIANESIKVSQVAKTAFEKRFPGASYASWKQLESENIYLVRFGYENKSLVAYIDGDGVLLATVRNLAEESLPYSVSEKISKEYSRFEIGMIEELTIESETSYVILLENEKVKMSVRVFNNGDSYLLKKEKKRTEKSLSKN